MDDLEGFRAEIARIGVGASPALDAVLDGLGDLVRAMPAEGADMPADATEAVRASVVVLGRLARMSAELTPELRADVLGAVTGLLAQAVALPSAGDQWLLVGRTLGLAVDAVAAWVAVYASVAGHDGVMH